MALTNASSQERMKQYLYGELSEEESQAVEDQVFDDTEFFYEIANLENELIDKYVQGKLKGEDLNRFERSLTRSDERRIQVENARALQRYIKEQKEATIPAAIEEPPRYLGWLALPATHYAMVGIIIFLVASGVWLLYDGYRARKEFARALDEQLQRENDLQQTIEAAKRQIEILQQQGIEQTGKAAELNAKLQQLQQDLETLRQTKNGSQNRAAGFIATPTIKSILESRGHAEATVLNYDAKFVTVRLLLDTETDYESYEIIENKKVIKDKLKAFTNSGKKYLDVSLPARNITFSVRGVDRTRGIEEEVGVYYLQVKRKK